MKYQGKRLTVFTGSSMGTSPAYVEAAQEFSQAIVEAGCSIIFGGGHVGLMGVVADAALEAGGAVHGVMPEAIVAGEVPHQGLSTLEIVPDMHTRKRRMAELGDAFIALPGGVGTLEELFEVWTWQQLNIHTKPVALYNTQGFWDPLIAMIDHVTANGFMTQEFRDALIIVDTPQELFAALDDWKPARTRWNGPALDQI